MVVTNHAPDHDTIEVRQTPGGAPLVTVYRAEDGEVHVVVNDGREVSDLVLGKMSP
jgi:hypothetical protein